MCPHCLALLGGCSLFFDSHVALSRHLTETFDDFPVWCGQVFLVGLRWVGLYA